MGINTFGDIDGLVSLYGPASGLGFISKTGDTVISLAQGQGEQGYTAYNDGEADIIEDGATFAGNLLAMKDGGRVDANLFCDYQDPTYTFDASAGATVVWVEHRQATDGMTSFTFDAGGGKTEDFCVRRSGTNWQIRVDSGTMASVFPMDTTAAHVYVCAHDGSANSAYFRQDATVNDNLTCEPSTQTYKNLRFMGRDGANSANTHFGLIAVYNRKLNATEMDDVVELANTWMTTGSGPSQVAPPTITEHPTPNQAASDGGSLTWTCAATGDPVVSYTWEAHKADAPGVFEPVTDVYPQADTTTPGTLIIGSLQADTDSGTVQCLVNNDAPTVITSQPAPFTVAASYPTSERFGPVRANDTGANYTWSIQPPGEAWQDLPVVGYESFVPDVVGDDQYLDVNSATSAQNGTLVRCFAKTDYSDGIYTNINTLNVVEA